MHNVLIGNTGSGKSTVAKVMVERYGLPLVSSGDVARELSDTDTSTDLALRQGAMAPEQAMRAAIRARLEAAEIQGGGWILDGFPRSIEQLVCLMQWTSGMPTFFYLEVEPWICLERLVGRDRIGDNPDAIGRKFESFEAKVQPLLQLLEGGGVLHTLDGTMPPGDICTVIDSCLR